MSRLKNKNTTYSDVGINLKKIRESQQSIGKLISSTHLFLRKGKVLSRVWTLRWTD